MPQIPGYDTQFTPQGALPMGASPDAFGAGVGRAIGNVAEGMSAINDKYQRAKDNEAAIEAYDLSGKTIAAWKQELTDRVNSLNPEDPEFKQQYESIYSDAEIWIQESRDSIIQNATNPKAKKYLAQHLATGQGSVLGMARQMQAEVASAHMGAKLDSSLKRSQDSIAADPSDENYQREVDGARNIIGSLDIDPEKKIKFERGFSHGAAVTQIQSLASRDARGFLSAVGATGGRVKKGGGLMGEVPAGESAEKSITLDIAGVKLTVPQFQGGADVTERVQQGAMAAVIAAKEAGASDADWPKFLSADMKALVEGPAPQVRPMTETEIAQVKPSFAGWAELTWAEKVAAVRQAEANLGGALAQKRAETQIKLKDAEEAAKRGLPFNYNDPDLSESSLRQQLGDAQGQRAYDQLRFTAQVGAAIASSAKMTNAQLQATLAQYQPTGGEGTDYKAPLYDAFATAVNARQAEIKHDFVAYAKNHGFPVAELDLSSPQAAGASYAKRVALAVSGVQDYGASDASGVDKAELEQIRTVMSKANPDAQLEYGRQFAFASKANPAVFDSLMRKLSPGDPMIPAAVAVSMKDGMVATGAGNQTGWQVGKFLLEGKHLLQGKDIDGKDTTGRPMQIGEESFNNFFRLAVGENAFSGPDAQYSEQMAGNTYQAAKNYLAAYLYHYHGGDGKQINAKMVKTAVDAVTGGAVRIGPNSLFAPWGMPVRDFSEQFLSAAGRTLEAAGVKGDPAQYVYANAGDGRYFVLHPNGSRIVGNRGAVEVDMRNWKAEAEARNKAYGEKLTPIEVPVWIPRGGF